MAAGGDRPSKYGVTSTRNGNNHWLKAGDGNYGWHEWSCCRHPNRWHTCIKDDPKQLQCPVTCKQGKVTGSRVLHQSPHSTVEDDDWTIKVTHLVYNANNKAYKHHRCYKTYDESKDQADRCECECETLTERNPKF